MNGRAFRLARSSDESEERIYVFLNDGTGTFASPGHLDTDGIPKAMAVGELSADGDEDLAVANAGLDTVSVFMGNGNGVFAAARSYQTRGDPTGIAIASLNSNNNSYPDVATADEEDGEVSVLLNRGNGELETAKDFPSGEGTSGLVAASFAGDPYVDLAVTDSSTDSVAVLTGNGAGSFSAPVEFTTGARPTALVAGNLDGDPGSDLVIANSAASGVSVLLDQFEQISASTNRVDLGTTRVGERGSPGAVTFTNTGNAPVEIESVGFFDQGVQEVRDTCRGATLALAQQCVFEAGLGVSTQASETLVGTVTLHYDGWMQYVSATFYGVAELGPGNVTVSASNTPEVCPRAYALCELLLYAAVEGAISEATLVKEGVRIEVDRTGGSTQRCETTILLYGSTSVFDLLGGKAASASRRSHKHRSTRVLLGEERIKLLGGQRKVIHLLLSATGKRLLGKLKTTATLDLLQERRGSDGKVVSTTTKIKVLPHRGRSTRSHGKT